MDWKDFFKLTVMKSGSASKPKKFFEVQMTLEDEFSLNELMITQFKHLNLSSSEKRNLSLSSRKIILSHHLFHGPQFEKIQRDFQTKLEALKEDQLTFSTHGGGIYLFSRLLCSQDLKSKKITCFTSELPLPKVWSAPQHKVQLIYRPEKRSFLSDFPSLWQESDDLDLFELKDFKASA